MELGISEDLIFSDNLNDMVNLTKRIFETIKLNWIRIKSSVHQFWKVMLNVRLKMKFVKIFKLDSGNNKSSTLLISMINDSIEKEFLETQSIQANSNFMLQILYELSSS